MATPAEAAAWWLRTALGDLAAAHAILQDDRLPPRLAAYLAQHAAEKALKATIALDGTEPPWTHDVVLLRQHAPRVVQVASTAIDVVRLSIATTAARYPEIEDPPYDPDEAERLVSDAAELIEVAKQYLEDAGTGASGWTPI